MSGSIACKFGGSSLSNPVAVRRSLGIILADKRRRHIVVSAPGCRHKGDAKVTDMIRACVKARAGLHPYKKLFDEIRDRYLDIIRGLGLDMSIEGALSQLRDAIDSKRSALAESRGEYIMALIMARLLDRPMVNAADIIKFERTGLNTQLTYDLIHERLKDLPDSVIPGYYGSMLCDNEIVLFARDGSDISGSLIARGIGADVYENWSDVPGAMSADPRIVADARTIPRMSHAELRELAAAGATVMHYAAVKPVMQARIPIHMRNTFDPDGAFTEVTTDAVHAPGTVIAVASKRGFYALTVSDTGSYDTDDFILKVSTVLHKLHVPIRHYSDGFEELTFLIDAIPERIEMTVDALSRKLQDADVCYKPAARIALIGEGMRGVPGFLGRAATTLGRHGINIITPGHSAMERSIIFAIDEANLEKATHALHTEFVEKLV